MGPSAPNVAGQYFIECSEFVDVTCPLDMACSIRDGEATSLTVTQSGFRVMLTDDDGSTVTTKVDANGEVDATMSDTQIDGACATVRTRSFVINPADPTAPTQVNVAFRYEGECAALQDCSIALVGRLRQADQPREPCQEQSTENVCVCCGCGCPIPANIPGCECGRPPP